MLEVGLRLDADRGFPFAIKPPSKKTKEQLYQEAIETRDGEGCMVAPTKSLAYTWRYYALGFKPGDKRKGQTSTLPAFQTIDVRCSNPLCFAPEHVYLRQRNDFKDDNQWKQIATQIDNLPLDGEFWMPGYKSEAERKNLRTNVMLHTVSRFAIRSQPTGGVNIIRLGTFGSEFLNRRDERSNTAHPILVNRAEPKNTIGSVWLGMLWGTWQTPQQVAVEKCSEKGCVFPKMPGASVCRSHWEWDGATVSYLRIHKIDPEREAFGRKSDDRNVYLGHKDALFHSGWLGEDKYGFLNTTTFTSGNNFVTRSKQERENDKWWKENVVDQGIEASGVMVRKTSKELKAEMEQMIETSLQQYNTEQSAASIRAFFRVAKEPSPIRPIYADELLKQEPDLRPGVNIQDSLRGKMRRGGGHGLGIRRKQRNRAPGWQSSRHNHDPQYFTRETVRTMEYEAFEAVVDEEDTYDE